MTMCEVEEQGTWMGQGTWMDFEVVLTAMSRSKEEDVVVLEMTSFNRQSLWSLAIDAQEKRDVEG